MPEVFAWAVGPPEEDLVELYVVERQVVMSINTDYDKVYLTSSFARQLAQDLNDAADAAVGKR
jgi:hypothetical protein